MVPMSHQSQKRAQWRLTFCLLETFSPGTTFSATWSMDEAESAWRPTVGESLPAAVTGGGIELCSWGSLSATKVDMLTCACNVSDCVLTCRYRESGGLDSSSSSSSRVADPEEEQQDGSGTSLEDSAMRGGAGAAAEHGEKILDGHYRPCRP